MSRRGESIFKRADGRWEARYIHHYEDGKAKYRYLYGKTYTEVKAKRREELMLPRPKISSAPKGLATFRDLSVLWLEHIKPNVKESTFSRYYRIVEGYLDPTFSAFLVSRLESAQLSAWVHTLLNEGGRNHTPLAPKSVCDILFVAKAILKHGQKEGYPCPDLSGLKNPPKAKKPSAVPTVKEQALLEKMLLSPEMRESGNHVCLGILFALYTGVRIGELCGLRFGDIDLQSQTVTISRTVERIADISPNTKRKTKLIVSEPKTENAVRVIPLQSFLIDYIRPFWQEPDIYILTGTTKPTEPHSFYMRYKTLMKKLGLPDYTFHALRHAFATRCIANHFDSKSLSEILGHANIATTLSLYVHPSLEQKREQMERLVPSVCL